LSAARPAASVARPGTPAARPLGRQLTEQVEKIKASIRAKVEHPFRVNKQQFAHVKVHYRGLVKNTAQLKTLLALSNLWMARQKLLLLNGVARPKAAIGA
jgi:IS5 family transposase